MSDLPPGTPFLQAVSSQGSPIRVIPTTSATSPGLQATDYLFWALQRPYERREERFVALLWPSFRLVHDLDETREVQCGVYYTQKGR